MVSHFFKDSLRTSFDPKVLCMPSPTYYGPVESTDPTEILIRMRAIASLFNGSFVEARFCTDLDVTRKFNVLKINLGCICVQKGWTNKAPCETVSKTKHWTSSYPSSTTTTTTNTTPHHHHKGLLFMQLKHFSIDVECSPYFHKNISTAKK